MGAVDANVTLDSDNARKEVAQMLAGKRAGPEGSIVRKQYGFWSTLNDLNLYSGDTFRVVSAARRIVEGALPDNALAGHGSLQARRGMVRTDKKMVVGKPLGFFEINLAAKDMAEMCAHLTLLQGAGFHALQPEDSFDEQACSHIQVPKLECIWPLYKKLVDLGKVTKMCYAVNGGAQGQGNDKARLIVDVSPEELARKMPELITLEQGTHVVACELAPTSDGQVESFPEGYSFPSANAVQCPMTMPPPPSSPMPARLIAPPPSPPPSDRPPPPSERQTPSNGRPRH